LISEKVLKLHKYLVMIQRIQSIYLLLASAMLWLEFILPFSRSSDYKLGYFSDEVYNIADHISLTAITSIAGALCLLIIFLYKNRKLQKNLIYITILIGLALYVTAFILIRQDTPDFMNVSSLFVGAFLPLGSIIFLILSLRGVNKDEQIVKSMDRLR